MNTRDSRRYSRDLALPCLRWDSVVHDTSASLVAPSLESTSVYIQERSQLDEALLVVIQQAEQALSALPRDAHTQNVNQGCLKLFLREENGR